MDDVVLALRRTLRSLGNWRVWRLILVPVALAVLFLLTGAVTCFGELTAFLLRVPPLSWLLGHGVDWLAGPLATVTAVLIMLVGSYLVATLFIATMLMPLLLRLLAGTDYADVALRGEDSLVASTLNSVSAAVIFAVGFVLTLPFWLIPGMGILLSLFWVAWLNRRTFVYDALAEHATTAELTAIRQDRRWVLLGLGGVMALLTGVPLLGLLVPSIAALAYIHFCLEALRRQRQAAPAASGKS